MTFQNGCGDWKEYRKLQGLVEVDFHHDGRPGEWKPSYDERMSAVYEITMNALRQAHESPSTMYVLFTHGRSTSRPGKTTSRSVVRKIMRSKEATQYIKRSDCIQHESVFVAAIKKPRRETMGSI